MQNEKQMFRSLISVRFSFQMGVAPTCMPEIKEHMQKKNQW